MTKFSDLYQRVIDGCERKLAHSRYTTAVCQTCPFDHTCCDQLVSVTSMEAAVLVSWIELQENKWTIVRGLKERYQLMRRAFGDVQKSGGEITEIYFKNHVKCVFYQDHKCQVYALRPIPCRETYAEPGESCYEHGSRADTGLQDAMAASPTHSDLGVKEMNTALLEIILGKPLRDVFTQAIKQQVRRQMSSRIV